MEISTIVRYYFEESGWTVDYHKDITSYVTILESEGYIVNRYAIEFFIHFGGIKARQPAFNTENEFDELHFDPTIVCQHIYRERVEIYENRIHESLVIIGEAYKEHLVLLMSSTGKVYGAYDDYLTLLGQDYSEALDTLYLRKETSDL